MTTSDRIIVLVGLMGSGKSRTGREVASLLKVPFVDADREIELAANCTVAEIFERFGEKEFRKLEKQVMGRLLSGGAIVLASGGGAFIQPEIRGIIKQRAISIWLKADLDTLIERTSRNNRRPLLQGVDPAKRLRELMDARYPVYAEADITVVTDRQTPQDAALHIKDELDRLAHGR
ncbi:MAG: shikimate kinase [Pseudomonadota bacterium]